MSADSVSRQSDEDQIRQLVSAWMAATKASDSETILSLMSDDAVFLGTGQPVIRKSDFAATAKTQTNGSAPHIDAASEIQEIKVLGNWAFMWTRLSVKVTPPNGGKTVTREGYTLSILKKEDGRWVLARDANMLSPVPANSMIEGGCFCGAVRFRGRLIPQSICNCHCEDCRRASGAPFVTWACFERRDFQIMSGTPKQHLQNERVRYFCQDCGTQLFWLRAEDATTICATVGSFDDPHQVTPQSQIWTEDKLPWIPICDTLPIHARDD